MYIGSRSNMRAGLSCVGKSFGEYTQDQVLALAASVASRSEHPIAKAISEEAERIVLRDNIFEGCSAPAGLLTEKNS